MSKKLMITLLEQANNGKDLLTILDSLTAEDNSSEYNESTLDSIEY